MTIELYTWSTPNGRKISIGLEEMGLEYSVHPINIGKGEQFAPDFLKISPNNKIPAIVDTDNGISVFESGAILMYLADKVGKFYPQEFLKRTKVNEWLMWQMGNFGPMLGRAHAYLHYNRRQGAFRRGMVCQGGHTALRRSRPAIGKIRIHDRRIFNCRHCDISLGRPP